MPVQPEDFKNHAYEEQIGVSLPPIVEAIVERTIIYFAEKLYPSLWAIDPQKALDRVLISDVNAGANIALGDAIEYLKGMNHKFPFTVYQVGDPDNTRTGETNNQHGSLGLEYFPDIGAKVTVYPSRFEMNWMTFFNRALDYQAALTLLGSDSATLTRLYTPILFGTTEVQIPFDLTFTLAKGTYTNALEEYFAQNRIWDLSHNIKISYYEYLLDNKGIFPVDNMLIRLAADNVVRVPGEYGITDVPDPLSVISTYPTNGQINTPVNTPISVQFSEPPIEQTLSVNIFPAIDHRTSLSGSVWTISPWVNLSGTTQYTVTIPQAASNADEITMLADYSFTFFT